MAARIEVRKSIWTFGPPVFGDTPKKKLFLVIAAAGLAVVLVFSVNIGRYRLQVDRYYSRAVKLHESNDLREGIKAYKQVLAIDPNHVDANIGLGMLEARKDPLRAIDRYKKAIAGDPGNSDAYACLAYAYYGLPGKLTEAIEQMKKAARLDPGNYQHHLALGLFLSKTGREGEAIDELETVVRLTPWVGIAHTKLIALYGRQGNEEKVRLHRAMLKPEKPMSAERKADK